MAAGAAGGYRRLVAEWARVSLKRREDDAALVRLVVLEAVVGHRFRLPPGAGADIGRNA